MADSAAEFPPVISHYRLEAEIGRGGMGAVYRGVDQRDNSPVAVKLLREELRNDSTFRERFEREAHVGALLRSPYTVHLLDSGFADPHYFLVMDFVDGRSLREELNEGPLPAGRALRIASNVARALEEADARSVVHRDIKPDNVILDSDGSARVLDFGIARQAGTLTLTQAGGFVGSLPYASPEHATGTVDHRSDIYSLGVTLYQMLTGHPPFTGDAIELLEHHRRTPMPEAPLAQVPAAAVSIVARCLEKEPGRRYQTATELTVALAHAVRLVEDAQAASDSASAAPAELASPTATAPGADATIGATIAAGKTIADPGGTVAATPSTPAPTAAAPGRATPVVADTLELKLSSPATTRFAGLRTGAMHGTLTATNTASGAVVASLVASDPDDACLFSLPSRVEVPAESSIDLPISWRPRARRWRGATQQRTFSVVADGGGPPSRVDAAFDDAPLRWPVAGGGLLGVGVIAIVLVAVLAGGGGGDGLAKVVTDPATEEAVEQVETPSTEEPAATEPPSDETETPDDPGPAIARTPGFVTTGGTRVPGQIAFISDRGGSASLYTMNADGTALRALTGSGSNERGPDWSPDGQQIAFASDVSGDFDIWLINADGTGLTALTTDSAFDGRPAWSPDGSEIAFVSTRTGNHDIFIINADGSNLRQITFDPGTEFRPTWSTDGRDLAFSSTRGGSLAIWRLRLTPQVDESGARRLTNGVANDGEPAWAPNGSLIAFESDRDGDSEIYVMAPDGSGQRRLTKDAAADLEPAWTSDSRFVIFMSLRTGDANLYLVEVATGEISQITSDAGFDGDATWHALPPPAAVDGDYRGELRAISEDAEQATAPLLEQIAAATDFAGQIAAIDEFWPEVIGIGSDALRQIEDLAPPPDLEADHALLLQGLRDILDAELKLISAATGGDFDAVVSANEAIRALTISVVASLSAEFRPLVDPLFR